jgi:hypothetical protein
MRFPRLRTTLSAFAALLVLVWVAVFLLLQSDSFWRWAGPRLVQMVNGHIRGALTVKDIRGNPFSGYVFRDLELSSREGKIFQAREVEIRISVSSLLALRPSISLALTQPSLNLQQDTRGQWNIEKLLPLRHSSGGAIWLPVSAIHLSPLLITGGEVTVQQAAGTRRYTGLDLNLAATLFHPFTARQRLGVKKSTLRATTPWGRFSLAGGFSFSHNLFQVDSLVLESEGRRLLSLTGNVPLTGGDKVLKVTGDLGPIPGAVFARFLPQWPPSWEAGGKLRVSGPWSKVKLSFQGKVQQASISLEGRISRVKETWSHDLVLQVTGLPPQMLEVLDPPRAKELAQASPLNARLHFQGDGLGWPPSRFAWNLRLEPLTYRRVKLAEGRISLAGTDKEQKLEGSL